MLPSERTQRTAFGLLGGATLAAAWLLPGTVHSALLGWIAALFFVLTLHVSKGRLFPFYLTGLVSNAIAFHWLLSTIQQFGGFPFVAAFAIYLLFVLVSSLQYVIAALLYRNLPASLDRIGMRGALAWIVSEMISVRIFPWHLGHTQLSFSPLAQAAELGGAVLLSFILLWTTESMILWRRESKILPSSLSLATVIGLLFFGWNRLSYLQTAQGPRQRVALIQGNVSLEDKHNIKYFTTNEERYHTLTEPFAGSSTLVIWPESVVQQWIYTGIQRVENDPRLPRFGKPLGMLIGSLSAEPPTRRFNSAIAILPDGTIPYPYHKQILMPFGEYTPFGDYLPWIKELNNTIGNFTPGDSITTFTYSFSKESETASTVTVSPLICYEDIIPNLAREAVKKGAELLVNLTNDAWFGQSIAPFQHHLIASFRSIETRRFLLRSTNTGLTAVVSPTGETISELPLFQEGTLLAEVWLPKEGQTLYVTYGDLPWWIVSFGCMLYLIFRSATRTIARRRS